MSKQYGTSGEGPLAISQVAKKQKREMTAWKRPSRWGSLAL
jgi:hypothetical protein